MAITMEAARVNAGLTQFEIAEKIGVTATCYWNWENGKIRISDKRFKQFCDIVKMDENDIILPIGLRLTKKE